MQVDVKDRLAGMAPFFSQVGYKPTSEWKEEIVLWDPLKAVTVPGSTAPGVDAVAKAVTDGNDVVILDTAGIPNGTYFFYSTNLNHLNNNTEEYGGMMTEIRIAP